MAEHCPVDDEMSFVQFRESFFYVVYFSNVLNVEEEEEKHRPTRATNVFTQPLRFQMKNTLTSRTGVLLINRLVDRRFRQRYERNRLILNIVEVSFRFDAEQRT